MFHTKVLAGLRLKEKFVTSQEEKIRVTRVAPAPVSKNIGEPIREIKINTDPAK